MPTTPPIDNRRGIVAMLLASAIFVGSDAIMKFAREGLSTGQVMTVRGAFASALTLAIVLHMGHGRRIATIFRPAVFLRGLVELGISALYIVALGHMPLAGLIALMQSTPLLIALWLAVTGAETMGWRRWLAVLSGFLGVLLVVKPGGTGMDVYALMAFAAATLVGARDIGTRRLGHDIPTALILASTVAITTCGGAALSLAEPWRPVAAPTLALLACAALFVVVGNYAMITAFRNVDIAVVSPFRYSIVVWGAIAGYLVFGEVPDLPAALGAALIVASGVYTVHRERVRRREAARA